MPTPAETPADRIASALALFIAPDDVAELRALHVERRNGRPVTMAGFYDGRHLADMAAAALQLTEFAAGVYLTMNPLKPEILARCANRFKVAESGDLAGDHHVLRRRWMLIDVDPVRVPGIGATDAEKAAARAVADAVRSYLDGLGWPAPIVADSGNGWHLFYRIDLPADDGELVKRCLEALARRFDTNTAKVDKAVYNAARIVRVPGSTARKGDATPDRPHRRGGIDGLPGEILPVPAELLNALAAEATPAAPAGAPHLNGQSARNGQASRTHRLDVPRWLEARGRAFRVKDAPESKGRTVYVLGVCPFNADHKDPDACVMQAPDGALSAVCKHNSCIGRGWQDFKKEIGDPDPDHYDPPLSSTGDDGAGESHAAIVLRLALPRVELFHDGDAPYATLAGTGQTWPVQSRPFAQLLRRWAHGAGITPGREAINTAQDTLAGKALFDGPALPVRVRLAELDGAVYLDLGRDDWSAVRITPAGWDVVTTYPLLRFRHPRGMLPLPLPERGGNLSTLRQLLNVGSDADWRLLVAWLLAAFRATGPYPPLLLTGEPGAAKSTAARVLRRLIDPNVAALRSEPRDGRDVAIAASNSWVVALDNLTRLPPWLSDCLCRLATGGGFSTRSLYTDGEEWLCDAQRPIVLTAITDIADRGDLLDRSMPVRLPAIPEDRRRPESEFWAAADAARPGVLGALLDAVAAGLKNLPTVKLARLPRMADFARWASACEGGLEWSPGAFMSAYADNVADANELALESSPLWGPLQAVVAAAQAPKLVVDPQTMALVESRADAWQGTAKELLDALELAFRQLAPPAKPPAPPAPLPRGWPKNARALTAKLRRLAPNMRRAGIDVGFDRIAQRRTITLSAAKVAPEPSFASSASLPPENTSILRGPMTQNDANGAADDANGAADDANGAAGKPRNSCGNDASNGNDATAATSTGRGGA
jgi:hypothetical protein